MGGGLIMWDWLFPGSIVTWFTVTELQFDVVRGLIIALLMAVMAADFLTLVDTALVRRIAGLVAVILFVGGIRFAIDYPVYLLDVLFVLAASISFGLVALQRVPSDEPALSPAKPARLPAQVAVPAVSMFERLREHAPHRRRFFPAGYTSDIKDDSHRLTVGLPGAGA